MQLGIALETELFLLSVLLGCAMGVAADVIRLLRIFLPHPKPLVFVEDFIYVLLFGFSLYAFCTGQTGAVRGFAAAGMIFGTAVERLTLGNAVIFLVRRLAEWLKKILLSPLARFMTKIVALIKRPFVKKCLNFKRNKKNPQKPLKVEI